jgi:membrane AbrB-like protein
MILMSDAFGGDMRLVALMQYLRIVMVAATASLVAGFAGVPARTGTGPGLETLFHAVPWQPFVQTMVLALACLILGRRIRFPAACLLLALTVGAVLQNAELLAITLPRWLMLAAYTLIGWTIGLRFSKSVFVYAMHTLPRILAAILLMIATCAGVGALLHLGAGIDPLTAYLATSPGGVDYMAIIAATSGADLGCVMAIQTARMLLVMLLEPPLARLVAIQAQKRRPARENVTP